MGNKTKEIVDQFGSKLMQAGLIVFDRDQNIYFKITQPKKGGGGHVEQSLFNKLRQYYNQNLNAVPNNSRIIVAVTYSPCKKCTSNVLPQFMADLDAVNRGIQIKFRFQKFWTLNAWKQAGGSTQVTDQGFWKNESDATVAYKELSMKYGNCIVDTIFKPSTDAERQIQEENRGATIRNVIERRNLVIAAVDSGPTHICKQYFVI